MRIYEAPESIMGPIKSKGWINLWWYGYHTHSDAPRPYDSQVTKSNSIVTLVFKMSNDQDCSFVISYFGQHKVSFRNFDWRMEFKRLTGRRAIPNTRNCLACSVIWSILPSLFHTKSPPISHAQNLKRSTNFLASSWTCKIWLPSTFIKKKKRKRLDFGHLSFTH